MLSSENVRCWQLTGNNSNKGKKPKETSFRVQWQKVVSQKFKEQAKKNAKEFVDLAFPPNTFTDEQLHELQFGVMDFYDMLTNLVVRTWIYYFKNGIPIDYELLKRSAESPLTSKMIDGNIFNGSALFLKLKRIRNEIEEPNDLPQLCIQYINSDQFIPTGSPMILSEYGFTLTGTLYAFYLQITALISDGFLAANKDWFEPRGTLKLISRQQDRVNGWVKELREDPTYEHLTAEKELKYLQGQPSLEQALAPGPVKGGNRTRKRKLRKNKHKCTHKRKRTLRSRTHKRLPTTAKSRIMRGK